MAPFRIGFTVLLVCLIATAWLGRSPQQCPQLSPSYDSTSPDISGLPTVKDGDSLLIGATEIRLFGIDAFEHHQLCSRDGKSWPCGKAATAALRRKLQDASVSCIQQDVDRYGRMVAECFMGRENLNGWMVRHGWALAYRRFSDKFIKDERLAEHSRLGVWRSSFIPPWQWRHNN